jgi:hypothetical protein
MTFRKTFAKGTLAAAAGVMAFSAVAATAGTAAAQSYDDRGGYYYDPCKRDKTNRGVVGGLLGAAIGAAVGSNAAARDVRTEGALLGGAVGATAGAVIGNSSAACNSGYAPRSSYNDDRYDYRQRSYYSDRLPSRDRAYYEDRYDDRYDGDRYTDSYTVVERPAPAADGCTLAESPIYLPDGRVQKRFVRVCRDSTGRFQVVE